MFTTNLSIIIITGTGAGHEPQTKVQGLMRKLSSTVLWLDLNPRTHGVGATRMVFLQSTTRAYTARTSIRGLARSMEPMTSRRAHHHQVLSGSIRGWIKKNKNTILVCRINYRKFGPHLAKMMEKIMFTITQKYIWTCRGQEINYIFFIELDKIKTLFVCEILCVTAASLKTTTTARRREDLQLLVVTTTTTTTNTTRDCFIARLAPHVTPPVAYI